MNVGVQQIGVWRGGEGHRMGSRQSYLCQNLKIKVYVCTFINPQNKATS